MKRTALFLFLTILLAAGASLSAACGDDGPETQTVEVKLGEWHIIPDPVSVDEGRVRFVVTNVGERLHELEVLQGDQEIAEVEDILPGETKSFEAALNGGDYTLACRLQEQTDEGIIDHLAMGMSSSFPVFFVVGEEPPPGAPQAQPDPEPDPQPDPQPDPEPDPEAE